VHIYARASAFAPKLAAKVTFFFDIYKFFYKKLKKICTLHADSQFLIHFGSFWTNYLSLLFLSYFCFALSALLHFDLVHRHAQKSGKPFSGLPLVV